MKNYVQKASGFETDIDAAIYGGPRIVWQRIINFERLSLAKLKELEPRLTGAQHAFLLEEIERREKVLQQMQSLL